VYRCCPRPYLSCRAWRGQGIHPSHRPPPLCAQLLALVLRDHTSALGAVAQKLRDHIICFGSGRAEIARPHICFASGRAEIARPHICFASGRNFCATAYQLRDRSRSRCAVSQSLRDHSQSRCVFCAVSESCFARRTLFHFSWNQRIWPVVWLREKWDTVVHKRVSGSMKSGTRLCARGGVGESLCANRVPLFMEPKPFAGMLVP